MKFLTKEENQKELDSLHLESKDIEVIEKVAVHGDKFHADDAGAVALIYLAKKELGLTEHSAFKWARYHVLRILRKDIPGVTFEYSNEVFVADMHDGKYDHHDLLVARYPKDSDLQLESEISKAIAKRQSCPYASAGKIWHAIGHLFGLKPKFVESLDKDLFLGLDLNDNFGGMVLDNGVKIVNPISAYVNAMNSPNITDEEAQFERFRNAVDFMSNVIATAINAARNAQKTHEEFGIDEIENNASEKFVVIDKYIPANLFDVNKIWFVVSPNNKPGWWQVSAVDSDKYPIIDRNKVIEDRRIFMEKFDDSHGDKIFFHKSRFLAVLPTKELAIGIANESINDNMNT